MLVQSHVNLYLKGLQPMPPPGDFSKNFEKKMKIGQNRLRDRFWGDLGLKFEFSVKNWSYLWAQTIISSCFEIRLLKKFRFLVNFSLLMGISSPGSIKIERGMKRYPRGLIMRFFGQMGGPNSPPAPPIPPPGSYYEIFWPDGRLIGAWRRSKLGIRYKV